MAPLLALFLMQLFELFTTFTSEIGKVQRPHTNPVRPPELSFRETLLVWFSYQEICREHMEHMESRLARFYGARAASFPNVLAACLRQ